MKDKYYRVSLITFSTALASAVLIPAILYLTDDGHPGWDQLSEKLSIFVYGYMIVVLLLAVSFVSGLYVWREYKVAWFWILPSGIVVLPTMFYLLALLVSYLVAPFWDPGWLMT